MDGNEEDEIQKKSRKWKDASMKGGVRKAFEESTDTISAPAGDLLTC